MKKLFLSFLIGGVAAASCFAQATGAGGAGAGAGAGGSVSGGAAGGITTGGRSPGQVNPGTPTAGNQNQNLGQIQRPIFLSGKVMMDDGSPVPMNVVIQRVCSGIHRSVAYTDSKGHFSFQWNQQGLVMADASEAGFGGRASGPTGGFGSSQSAGGTNGLAADPFANQMMNCFLRADLGGYRSDEVNLFNRSQMDNPDVGQIVLHRMANVEGLSISATGFMAPKDAKKSYEKGLQSMLKNKSDDAAKDFEKAVTTYPKYADAWVSLGKIRIQQKSFEPAKDALMKAMEADPKLVAPYVELGMLAAQQAKWEEAAQYLDKALKLDPVDYPGAWYADAAANYNLQRYDLAEKSAREAIKTDPKHRNPRSDYLLGLILAEKHDFTNAAEELRTYLKLVPNAPDSGTVKDQIGQLEKFIADTKEASK